MDHLLLEGIVSSERLADRVRPDAHDRLLADVAEQINVDPSQPSTSRAIIKRAVIFLHECFPASRETAED